MAKKRCITILVCLISLAATAQHTYKADSLYTLGNYSAAINEYSKEDSSRASLQIARAYNAMGNYGKAVTQYEASLKKDINNSTAAFELGKLYLKLKKPEEAYVLFNDLSLDGSNNPEYNYYVGRTLQEVEKNVRASEYFKRAVKADSTHLRSLFQLSKYYVANRNKKSALEYINLGLKVYPEDVSLINLKALALFNGSMYKEAIPLFEQLLDSGEEKKHIYQKLGFSYFKNWEFDKAKDTYKQLLNFEDTKAEALFSLSGVYFKERKLDSAAYYTKLSIKEQEPYLLEEYGMLASIERDLNHLKTALHYYKLASAEDDTNQRVAYQICALEDQTNEDTEEKLKYYQQFIERFGGDDNYYTQLAHKRIRELKEEIHFSVD